MHNSLFKFDNPRKQLPNFMGIAFKTNATLISNLTSLRILTTHLGDNSSLLSVVRCPPSYSYESIEDEREYADTADDNVNKMANNYLPQSIRFFFNSLTTN